MVVLRQEREKSEDTAVSLSLGERDRRGELEAPHPDPPIKGREKSVAVPVRESGEVSGGTHQGEGEIGKTPLPFPPSGERTGRGGASGTPTPALPIKVEGEVSGSAVREREKSERHCCPLPSRGEGQGEGELRAPPPRPSP